MRKALQEDNNLKLINNTNSIFSLELRDEEIRMRTPQRMAGERANSNIRSSDLSSPRQYNS